MVLEGKATVWQPLPLTLAVLYGRWVLVYSVHGPQLHSSKFVILIVVYKLEFTTLCRFSPQFYITKENRGNEGTCVGVSRWPVRDHNHHTTTDMWLYRAYSGNLYHGGELVRTLPSFTQGDTITCILDMEAHTVSFAKNDKVWSNIYCQYSSDWVLCSCLIFVCLFSFSFRSQSWHLKVWSLMNYILVCYSTAVTLERRYSVYCTDLLDLLFIWIRFIISMGNVKYLETQAATHTGFALTSYYWIIAALGYTWKKLVSHTAQYVSKIFCTAKPSKHVKFCTCHRWLWVISRWEACPAVCFLETLSAAPGLLCYSSQQCICCVGSTSVTSGPRT